MTEPLDGPATSARPSDASDPLGTTGPFGGAPAPGTPDSLEVPVAPVSPATGGRRTPAWRVGLVVGALAILAGGAAFAIASSPSPAPSAGTTAPVADQGWVAPAGARSGVTPGADGAWGRGHHGGQLGRDVTITSIDGSKISLKTEDDWTRTITVTDATELTKGGQDIEVSDLKVGDQVVFSQTRNTDGTYTIDALAVVVPTIGGTVKDVTSSGFTLDARNGLAWTVTVNGSTVYTLGASEAKGSKADVTAGATVVVQGTQGTGNTLTASSVRIALPRVAGEVTAKSGSTLTLTRRDGTTFTVKTTSSTTYRVAGKETASLADITVGMTVVAEGTQASDGSLTATIVAAGQGLGKGLGDGLGGGFPGMDDGHGFPGMGGGHGGRGGWGMPGQPAPSASPSTGGSTG